MAGDTNKMEAALLRTMTLLATLSVAAEIRFGMRERKAGRDPSAEEIQDVAIQELKTDAELFNALLFQLQSSLALTKENESPDELSKASQSVNYFIDLVRLQKASQILHRVHQRLLSLYPQITEEEAEKARLLKKWGDALQESNTSEFEEQLGAFVNEGKHFINSISRVFA